MEKGAWMVLLFVFVSFVFVSGDYYCNCEEYDESEDNPIDFCDVCSGCANDGEPDCNSWEDCVGQTIGEYDGTCTQVECNPACSGGEICDSSFNCVECISNGDCVSGEECVLSVCSDILPSPCFDDTDCEVDEICDEYDECVDDPGCSDDSDCGVDEICDEYDECVDDPGCTTDSDCGDATIWTCNLASNTCGCKLTQCTSDDYYQEFDCYYDEIYNYTEFTPCISEESCGRWDWANYEYDDIFVSSCNDGCCIEDDGNCAPSIYNSISNCTSPSPSTFYCNGDQPWENESIVSFLGDSCLESSSCSSGFVQNPLDPCQYGCTDGVCDERNDCDGALFWTDMNGASIGNASVGDSVRMIVEDTCQNTDLIFTVFDTDYFDEEIYSAQVLSNSSGFASAIWAISEDQEEDEYYFEVSLLDETLVNTSGELDVFAGGIDDPINITIISPQCGSNISQGTSMTIKISVLDSDDEVFGNLTVNDDDVYPLTNGLNEIPYPFNDYGNIPLIAYVENAGGKKQKAVSNIMVINSAEQQKYAAACIDEPNNFDNLETSRVNFRADSSAGIKCYNSICQRFEHDSKELKYTWIFSTRVGSVNDGWSKLGNLSTSYEFPYPYQSPGNNWAKLKVEMV